MLQFGLVGTGYWGPNIARSVELTERGQVRWLCDVNEQRLNKLAVKYPRAKATVEYEKILADKDLDAVAISTPVATHFELTKKALERGKNVLVEKPITSTVDEAAELFRLADKVGKKLMVGHVFEYNATVRYLKKLIQSGELGEVYYLHMERTNLGPVRTDVNAVWDLATHDLSIMCYLLDKTPHSVTARGESYLNPGVEDVAFANYSFENKEIANLHVSWINPRKVRQITVVGSQKMVIWDDLDLKAPVKVFDKRVDLPNPEEGPVPDTYLDYKTALVDGGMTVPSIPLNQPLKAEIEHFMDCLDQNARPQSDGYVGYKIMKLLEATAKSMGEDSRSVDIDIRGREEMLS